MFLGEEQEATRPKSQCLQNLSALSIIVQTSLHTTLGLLICFIFSPISFFLLTVDFYLQYLIHGLCMKGSGETALRTACFSRI